MRSTDTGDAVSASVLLVLAVSVRFTVTTLTIKYHKIVLRTITEYSVYLVFDFSAWDFAAATCNVGLSGALYQLWPVAFPDRT